MMALFVRLSIFFDILMGKNIKITKASQLAALKTETFIAGVIIAVIFLLIVWGIAQLVPYEGGREDRSGRKRQIIFYVVGFINIVVLFAINTFRVSGSIARQSLQGEFITTNVISIVICALVFFVGGFALSKIFKNGKVGTLFPSRK